MGRFCHTIPGVIAIQMKHGREFLELPADCVRLGFELALEMFDDSSAGEQS